MRCLLEGLEYYNREVVAEDGIMTRKRLEESMG